MQYKLVAVDIDGTLTSVNSTLPDENKRVISMLNAEGVHFVIATGRNDYQVTWLASELGIPPVIIGCNGATVRDLDGNITYVYEFMSNEALEMLFKAAAGGKTPMRLYSLEHSYIIQAVHERINRQNEKQASTYAKVLLENNTHIIVDSYEHFLTFEDKIIKAVNINSDFDGLISLQQKINQIPGIISYRSSRNCLDVMNGNVSKGNALKILAEKFGISRDQVIAIGDGENDIPMLEYAGLAVAMGNSEDKVKQAADMVTKTNHEAGVAHALKEIFCI